MKDIRKVILEADKVLILAGAGMSCDSGLPAFRTPEGFWNHYPPLRGKSFHQVSSPAMQDEDPSLFAGFYLHRLQMYRDTKPHSGYEKLLSFLEKHNKDYFVKTTNVDGHFEASGFNPNRIEEIHGSIHQWQCTRFSCKSGHFDAPVGFKVDADLKPSFIPKCPTCDNLARPSILMFDDFDWNSRIQSKQASRYAAWYYEIFKNDDGKLAILEFGAGQAIPTLRVIHNKILMECPESTGFRVNPDPNDDTTRYNMKMVYKSTKEFIHELEFAAEVTL